MNATPKPATAYPPQPAASLARQKTEVVREAPRANVMSLQASQNSQKAQEEPARQVSRLRGGCEFLMGICACLTCETCCVDGCC